MNATGPIVAVVIALVLILIHHYAVKWYKRPNRRIVFTGINTWDSPSKCCWSTKPFEVKAGDSNPSFEYKSSKTKSQQIFLVVGPTWSRVLHNTPGMEHWTNPNVTIIQVFIQPEGLYKKDMGRDVIQYCNRPNMDANFKIQIR